jgi:hypothetical protein
MQRSKKTKEDALRSEWRSVFKKDLTGPTLLEMSGNPTYQALTRLNGVKLAHHFLALGKMVNETPFTAVVRYCVHAHPC